MRDPKSIRKLFSCHEKSMDEIGITFWANSISKRKENLINKDWIKDIKSNPKCDDAINQAATPYRAGGSATPRA
jgi:hypothetical protein